MPAPKTSQEADSRLDSVFLELVLDEDERFIDVSNLALIKAIKAEVK